MSHRGRAACGTQPSSPLCDQGHFCDPIRVKKKICRQLYLLFCTLTKEPKSDNAYAFNVHHTLLRSNQSTRLLRCLGKPRARSESRCCCIFFFSLSSLFAGLLFLHVASSLYFTPPLASAPRREARSLPRLSEGFSGNCIVTKILSRTAALQALCIYIEFGGKINRSQKKTHYNWSCTI